MASRRDYLSYRGILNYHRKPVSCRYCSKSFSARELERHLFADHGRSLPSRDCCPWCEGRVFWKPREISKNARHLSECFRRYWRQFEVREEPEPRRPVEPAPSVFQDFFAPYPNCESRHDFGRAKISHPNFYVAAFIIPSLENPSSAWVRPILEGNEIRFVECDDLAIRYIRTFLALRDSPQGKAVGWYHLIVRAYALGTFFEKFREYVEDKKDGAFLLEHSCWCDGGRRHREPIHRHHRHMIAVARDGNDFMQRCWKRVQVRDPPIRNYRYKYQKKIATWNHLMNVLFYVSSRKASCNFGEERSDPSLKVDDPDEEGSRKGGDKLSHFYIFNPVTPRFKMSAALVVEGGLQQLLTQRKGSCSVMPFARHCVRLTRSGHPVYGVQVRHVLNSNEDRKWLRSVVPVRKDFCPTGAVNRQVSSAYFHLMDGHRMHFERVEACREMGDEAWAAMQARKGNLFFDAVKDDWWYPPQNQQKVLNQVVPLLRELEECERRLENQKVDHERQLTACRQRESELRKEMESQKVDQQSCRQRESELRKEMESQKVDFERQLESQKVDFERQLERARADYEREKMERRELQKRYDTLLNAALNNDKTTVYKWTSPS